MTTLLIEFRQNYLGTDLVATLASLKVNDFSHCDRLWVKNKMAAGDIHLKSSRGVKEFYCQTESERRGRKR